MKRFLKKSWHSIPIALVSAVLVLVLIGGTAFAAYQFISATTTVEVVEGLTIEVDATDNLWITGTGWQTIEATYTIPDAHPGETATIPIRITNMGYAELTVSVTYSVTHPQYGSGKVTVSGEWPDGLTVPARVKFESEGGTLEGSITVSVAGDAPIGSYAVTINFNRASP